METPRTSAAQTPFGINLYGYLTSNVGLGVVARNTARMLDATGTPFTAVDLDPGAGGVDTTLAGLLSRHNGQTSHPVNLFHMNPDRLRQRITRRQNDIDFDATLNAAMPFWETTRLPRAWLPTLAAMDVILAPTLFVRDAVLADLPDSAVIHFPQTAFLPEGIVSDRSPFGVPDDKVAFVMSFAAASDIDRKNPWGTIDAFVRAELASEAVLVIKVNNPQAPGQARSLNRLRDLAARTENVILLERPMDYREVLSLYASCDVLVSLHRSEGLGLNMLEAMLLGVPCLATGWSGNMDFMTGTSAALVDYHLVDVEVSRSSPYHPSNTGVAACWAEPDLDHASTLIRELAGDSAQRRRLGEAGREAAKEAQSRYLEGKPLQALEAALRTWNPDRPQRRHIDTLKRSATTDYISWAARAALRRLRARLS